MPEEELMKLSNSDLIDRVSMFIRVDYAGKSGMDKLRVILSRGLELHSEFKSILDSLSPEQQVVLAETMNLFGEHVTNGSRKRLITTVNEMRRRWESPTISSNAGNSIKI